MTELERQPAALGRELDYPPTPGARRVGAASGSSGGRAPARAPCPGGPRILRALAIAGLVVLLARGDRAGRLARGSRRAARPARHRRGRDRGHARAGPARRPSAGRCWASRAASRDAPGELGFEPLVPTRARPPGPRPRGPRPSPAAPSRSSIAPSAPPAANDDDRRRPADHRASRPDRRRVPAQGRAAGDHGRAAAGRRPPRRLDRRRAALLLLRAGPGEIAEHELEVAQNVLLVDHGGVLVRLEGAFGSARRSGSPTRSSPP